MWDNWFSPTLLLGIYNGTTISENSLRVSYKVSDLKKKYMQNSSKLENAEYYQEEHNYFTNPVKQRNPFKKIFWCISFRHLDS